MEGLLLPQLLEAASDVSDVNIIDARQRTALHWAALRGDLHAVESLLNAGADVNRTDEFKCTPLHYAVSAATPRIVELLILSGADVHSTDNGDNSPLHYAARHTDDLESVKILIRAGAQVDRKNAPGNTPFAGAAMMNRVTIGKYLLKCGADRYSTNKYGDTPLRETIHHNRHKFLRMLLEDETRCDDINTRGSSLLHALALEGDTKTVRILMAASLNRFDTEQKNYQGETAMDICEKRIRVPEGFKEAFSVLLSTFPLS